MPVTSQATLGPTCLCSHCSCCVRMAARLLLRLRMPGRAAAFSGHLIVVTLLLLGLAMRPLTGDLHRQEVGLTIITSTQEPASAALPFPGQLPAKRRVGKAYTGPPAWPRPKHLASSYFGRCAGHPGCKIAAPFSCLPGLALSASPMVRMQRKTKTKNMQTDFQPCNASSYAKQAPAHRRFTPLIAVREFLMICTRKMTH